MSDPRFAIDLKTNTIDTTALDNIFYKLSTNRKPLILFKDYVFDSTKYDISQHLNNWFVFNSIDDCVSLEHIYIVECDPFGNDGKYYFVDKFKCIEHINITSTALYSLKCDYKKLIKFAMLYPGLKRELIEYFRKFKVDSHVDVLIEYLNYIYNPDLLTMLFNTSQTVTNIEGLATLPVKTEEEQQSRLKFIETVIERQNLQNDDIVTLLSNNEINPTLFLDQITTEEAYYNLAQQYVVLRDYTRMTSERYSFLWAAKFGHVNELESNITSSEYAYRFAKYIRKSSYLKSRINEPSVAYKWALEFKEDINDMRTIVINSADPFYCALFAGSIDHVNDNTHPLYSTYNSIVLSSNDNKPLYYWAILTGLDLDDISQRMYDNPQNYDNEGWIVQFVLRYPDHRYTPLMQDLFDKVSHPIHLFHWALDFTNDLSVCASKFYSYSGTDDVSKIAYNWIKSFGYDSNLLTFITDKFWRLRTEYLLGVNIW